MNTHESYYAGIERDEEAKKIAEGIMDAGFACLVEKFGIVDPECFAAMIKRDSFDYTIWRREYFDNIVYYHLL